MKLGNQRNSKRLKQANVDWTIFENQISQFIIAQKMRTVFI